MEHKRNVSRLWAWALLFALVAAMLPGAARAAEDTVRIRSAADWEEFAQNCRLDAWSWGKTVVLECDLTLDGGSVVPIFGGTFEGGGHTIRSFSLEADGSHQGLFRYLQEGAVVQNLSVSGIVGAGGKYRALGGIVGSNGGTLRRCSFSGTVSGADAVGGIAGVNETSGEIVNCTVFGVLSGEHAVGGVAGENYGSIVRCENFALVNTKETTASPELSEIDWRDLNSTENLPACTDLGGIVGYSKGIVQDCTNRADVGYPHTGYNVGGVAGRQSGYLDGCTNYGHIQGRKEVGGIVGQAEPYTLLQYEEDSLQGMQVELDKLIDLLEDTLKNADDSRHGVSATLTDINRIATDIQRESEVMIDDLTAFGSESVDTINTLSARVSRLIEQSVPIVEKLGVFLDDTARSLEKLEDVLEKLERISQESDILPELQLGLRATHEALQLAEQGTAELGEALDELRDALGSPSQIAPALEKLRTATATLGEAGGKFRTATEHLQKVVDELAAHSEEFQEISEELREILRLLTDGTRALSEATEELHAALQELSEEETLRFPKLDKSFYEQETRLRASLKELFTASETLNRQLNTGGDVLSQDLQAVLDQLRVVVDLLWSPEDAGDTFVDVSEEDIAARTPGKIARCANYGAVEGDVNVGGAVGAMAIEYDFDPEDDIIAQGSRSLRFRYLTRAVLYDCENRGAVTSRKDCAGGAVGRMDLGLVFDCRSYGGVKSSNGDYVGGIAGAAYSTVRACWAKCALSGQEHVGGVAGYGTEITLCRTLVEITGATAYLGAIAGEAEGPLQDNRFVSETLGGVDSISYAGKAEPMAFADFTAQREMPLHFDDLSLRFTADGALVAELPFAYGEAIAPEDIPAVPPRAGFYGAWERTDLSDLRFSAEIKAVYTPWTTVLANEDGSILVEGVFSPGTALRAELGDFPAVPAQTLAQWAVALEGGEDAHFAALRIRCPEGKRRVCAWVERDGVWEKLPAERDGSYLRIALDGGEARICLTAAPLPWWIFAASGGAAAALAAIVVRVRARRRAAARRKESGDGEDH